MKSLYMYMLLIKKSLAFDTSIIKMQNAELITACQLSLQINNRLNETVFHSNIRLSRNSVFSHFTIEASYPSAAKRMFYFSQLLTNRINFLDCIFLFTGYMSSILMHIFLNFLFLHEAL